MGCVSNMFLFYPAANSSDHVGIPPWPWIGSDLFGKSLSQDLPRNIQRPNPGPIQDLGSKPEALQITTKNPGPKKMALATSPCLFVASAAILTKDHKKKSPKLHHVETSFSKIRFSDGACHRSSISMADAGCFLAGAARAFSDNDRGGRWAAGAGAAGLGLAVLAGAELEVAAPPLGHDAAVLA